MAAGRGRERQDTAWSNHAMMFLRFHGGSGSFRTTADLDFFRGLPFTKCIPALYDDGSIGGEEAKKLKAFTDIGDEECMTRA